METSINRNRLFIGSCFALITTAFAFSLRAGIMNNLASDFHLTDTQLGWIAFMGTFGFPIATLVGGPLYNSLGPKNLGYIAFFSHIIGITFSILSTSFLPLFISTFLVSFGNGMVEAAFNPMIASMYDNNKTNMLNRFHTWFPGGLAIGALIAFGMTQINSPWQLKLAVMYIPTIIYGFLFFGQKFPQASASMSRSNAENLKAMFSSPIFLFMLVCMAMTATTELGTQGWVERILGKSKAEPLLILAFITGLMAVGRFFAGPIVHKLNITGVLLASAIVSTIAVYMMSQATGPMVYVSAVLFAVGVCYFWPNMIAFVAEYQPKTGAFGMSLIGGVGMVGLSIFNPIIGGWIDSNRTKALANGLTGDAAELAAGQATLANIAILPALLVVAFAVLYFVMRKRVAEHSALQQA